LNVAVVGAGAWGTVFAGLLGDRGHDVQLLGRERNGSVIAGADLVVVAVPSRSFGEVVETLPGSAPILSLTKGLDPDTGGRLSARVKGRPFAVFSGPNIAQGDRRRASGRGRDRERGRGARGRASARDQLADLPCLRER
jgi:glycerol-3-phosphate dehydrogenase (NAD(P)+)